MKIGITLPQFGTQATKENVAWLAKTAEEEHFDSLWVNERLLWPLIVLVKRNFEIITLTFPFRADSHKEDGIRRAPFSGTVDDVGDDIRRIKEMGVDHAILQLTEPDMNRLIDTAKQVYKFDK